MMFRATDGALLVPQKKRKKRSARQASTGRFATDRARWKALVDRNPAADGIFFVAVRTTGIYCRPSCKSRPPLRQNVTFFQTADEAERAGFRACKRCRPRDASYQPHARLVAAACRQIAAAEPQPSLSELAASAGLSPAHFHRVFKQLTGLTPKAYAAQNRAERLRGELGRARTATGAIFAAGFGSTSRFYEKSARLLGMTPKAFREGGAGTQIHYAVGRCWLGLILVAATERGVCAIQIGDDAKALVRALQERFPRAVLRDADAAFRKTVAQVIAFVEEPRRPLGLPLDLRGTALQQRVWQALAKIPMGTTLTYSQLAARVGKPRAVRAVANACGANPVAIAIPCHRVVRTGGGLGGYRWGVEIKDKLLRREGVWAKNGKAARTQ